MKCPECGLENPPSAGRCDCGYDFLEVGQDTAGLARGVAINRDRQRFDEALSRIAHKLICPMCAGATHRYKDAFDKCMTCFAVRYLDSVAGQEAQKLNEHNKMIWRIQLTVMVGIFLGIGFGFFIEWQLKQGVELVVTIGIALTCLMYVYAVHWGVQLLSKKDVKVYAGGFERDYSDHIRTGGMVPPGGS